MLKMSLTAKKNPFLSELKLELLVKWPTAILKLYVYLERIEISKCGGGEDGEFLGAGVRGENKNRIRTEVLLHWQDVGWLWLTELLGCWISYNELSSAPMKEQQFWGHSGFKKLQPMISIWMSAN